MNQKLHGKVVWITGASAGIGEAAAHELRRAGADVIISARRREQLERVQAELEDGPEHAFVLPLDLADHEALPAKVDEALAWRGRVDVMIHNGGISQRSLVADTSMEVLERLMAVNFFGAVALTQALLPHFLARRSGQFVVVSSLVGVFGTPLRAGYSASKHALHGFFDSLRAEVADSGIGVTLFCPGYVQTAVSMSALTGDGKPQGTMDDATANGMSPQRCARALVQAIAAGTTETYVGGFERFGVYIKRLSPALFARILRRVDVT